MGQLSGTVRLEGNAIADAKVSVVDAEASSPGNWTVVGGDVSAADGSWSVSGLDHGPDRYHALVQLDDGNYYNAESLPFLTVDAVFEPGPATLSIDPLPPEIGPAIPDSEVYLHDDWGDNKLTNRDESGTTTYNGVEGVYRPEWTTENGSPSVSNQTLQISGGGSAGDGDRIHADINIDLSYDLIVDATGVDLSSMGPNGADQFNVGIYAQQVTESSFDQFHESYNIEMQGSGDVALSKRQSDGNRVALIDGSWSSGDSNFRVTRSPSGDFELFVDGTSQGSVTDTEFTNPQYHTFTAREGGDGSISEIKVS